MCILFILHSILFYCCLHIQNAATTFSETFNDFVLQPGNYSIAVRTYVYIVMCIYIYIHICVAG